MAWLAENWFWVLIGILFVGMHVFGHGGHGGHGTHRGNGSTDKPGTGSDKSAGHRH